VLFAVSLVIMQATLVYMTPEAFVCLHALFSLPLLFAVAVTYNKCEHFPSPSRPTHTHHACTPDASVHQRAFTLHPACVRG